MNYFSISEAQAFRSQKANVQNCARAWNQEQSYLAAGACSLSDLTAETEVATSWCTKQQHGDCPWSHWLLKLRLDSWRHAHVSCCSGTEWSFGQIYNNVWLDTQSWLNSLSLPSSALHVSAVGVDAAVSWRRWDLGLGGTAMPGSADQWYHTDGKRQQVSQDNFQSRLKC